jgi:8-oxo-dGTP pyrophosphatase MutT (NUDIX family)
VSGFRIVGTTGICDAGFLSVEDLDLRGPDGEEFSRTIVRHPGAVVVVPVESDGMTARLVRQFRAAPGRELLEVPAGKRDVDGEPPEATASRELEEEIGCRPGKLVPLAEFYNSPGFCDEYTHVFAALDLVDLPARRAQGAEERAMSVERVALGDVERLVGTRELVDAKSIVGLLLTRRLLESGLADY